MFKRTLRSVLLAAPLLLALALPVYAAFTGNLAGRPISGADTTSCQATAYAKVDNKIVLLTAAHCCPVSNCSTGGQTVTGPGGVVIGTWATDHGSADHDLAVINLNAGNWPSTLNHVYRGAVSGNDYWTVVQNYTSALSCINFVTGTVYQNFQITNTSTLAYRTGSAVGYNDHDADYSHCTIQTNIDYHGDCCHDSGSSFFSAANTNTPWALASGRSGPDMYVTPLYEGMKDLNAYWLSHGGGTGAKLCFTATCS